MILTIYPKYTYIYIKSTMSILAQQLNKLRQNNAVSIAPGAPRATFILDKQTARNTTLDVLFTMAVLGYSQIKKSIFHNGRALGQQLLSEQNKQINRNKLSKQENKKLSIKLTKFLLIISPLFLNKSSQSIIQYLLRNYNIHVFQNQQIALIFLQYWQQQSYSKLLANIQIKTPNLQFLKALQTQPNAKSQPINFNYILKSLTYSRALIDTLLTFCRKYIKQEDVESEQLEIQLVSRATNYKIQVQKQSSQNTIIKRDFKMFVLQILVQITKRGITGFEKQICQFCVWVSKQQREDVYSMSMVLAMLLLQNQQYHSQWINRVIINLLSKNQSLTKNIFSFILIILQRYPILITHNILSSLLNKQYFVLYLTQSSSSLSIPFYILFQYLLHSEFQNKGTVLQILKAICLKVKQQQFVKVREIVYWTKIFKILQDKIEVLEKKVQNALVKFIGDMLAYQYAVYINQNKKYPISGVFNKQQVSKNGKVNWSLITKAQLQIQQQPIEQQKHIDQQSIQQYQPESEPKRNQSSLLTIFSKYTKNIITKINLTNPQQYQIAKTLVNSFYNQSQQETSIQTINYEQKNKLFEDSKFFEENYNSDMFYYDFQHRDYNIGIKYLMKDGSIQMCVKILEKLGEDVQAAGDILYRQLCRQAIQKLAILSQNHYKVVVTSLGRLYHQYCKNTQIQLIKLLNETMLKISYAIFTKCGTQKGKYYKLIASHAKFLANLTISHVFGQNYALETYKKLIEIFGHENSYCFIIGVAELLATKTSNKKLFGNFIQKVLIPSMRKDQTSQSQNQNEYYNSLLNLFQTVNKCLVFCYRTLEQSQQEQDNQQQQTKSNNLKLQGVAKKMILNFFGLISSKNKRAIIRKVFMFLSSLFKSYKVTGMFKQVLTIINRKQQLKLCTAASKIYKILTQISDCTKGPLKQTTKSIMTNILKLFPLSLKVDVLGPLLPLNQVYEELGNDLFESSVKIFENLKYFINIVPKEATDQWSKFSRQCIKRSFIPNQQVSTQILQLYSQEKENTNLVKFICNMTEFAKQQCLSLLPKMMEIIFKQAKQPNSYTLAIFFTLAKNLKEFIDPYLAEIFRISIQVEDNHVKKFIDGIVQSFTAPTLIMLAKNHAKTVQNVDNFSYFLKKISGKVNFQSIWKTSQNFFARSLNTLVQQQLSYKNLHDQQSEVFVTQVMKMNDNQLRKIIIDYVRWASQRTNNDNTAALIFNSRKNLILVIFEKLSQKLGDLFIHFYGYIFEDLVKDLKSLEIMEQKKSFITNEKARKRDRQISEYALNCTTQYTRQLLTTVKSLFDHDPNNQFMDSIKFDTIVPQIANIFNMTKFDQHYSSLITNNLQPCLISLFKNTIDDYKIKTINTQILRMLRTKDQRISQGIYKFYDEVIGYLDYRFLLFTDQMIPLLIEASSSRNSVIKKSVESIIYKVQNLSGQKIDRINR